MITPISNCNGVKSVFTIDEFGFLRGLRGGNLSHVFPFEAPAKQRDWLCVHSQSFERQLMVTNYPGGATRYSGLGGSSPSRRQSALARV